MITTQGGKPGQNIQLVKTVLSQPGGKPAQSTIVLAQPRAQTGMATATAEHVSMSDTSRDMSCSSSICHKNTHYTRVTKPKDTKHQTRFTAWSLQRKVSKLCPRLVC